MATYGYIMHHGIKGQKWGVRNGPPYPLDYEQHNSKEKKLNTKSSLDNYSGNNEKKKNIIKSARNYIGTKSGHYLRNEKNTDLPKNDKDAEKQGWRKLSSKESAMHQFNKSGGVENSKWVSPDGHKEVVFTDKGRKQHITTDQRDIGTYNFFDPTNDPLKHTVADVLPYIILGNSEDDQSTAYGRVAESVKSFLKKSPEELDSSNGKEVVNAITSDSSKKTIKDLMAESKERREAVKEFKKETKAAYKESKANLKETKAIKKADAREYLKTQNELGAKGAIYTLSGVASKFGTVPITGTTNLISPLTISRYAELLAKGYTTKMANDALGLKGDKRLTVSQVSKIIDQKLVREINEKSGYSPNGTYMGPLALNNHGYASMNFRTANKNLIEKNNANYEKFENSKSLYKEAKKNLQSAKEAKDISKAWATNKSKLEYKNALTDEEKKKAKRKVQAQDKVTKYVAIKGGKKIAKLGTKVAIGAALAPK